MTRKTGIPGLLAGGICSLTLAGAASADHVLKICEICEAGPGNSHQWISRSGGGDTENVIVLAPKSRATMLACTHAPILSS